MKNRIDRRSFLKTSGILAAGVVQAGLGNTRLLAAELANGAPHAEKLGWRLGSLYRIGKPYNKSSQLTFYRAIDQVASLGLHYIEGSARPALSKNSPGIHIDPSMSEEARKKLKLRLADARVKLASYYSTKLTGDEEKCREEFALAKDMGIETLVGEPPLDSFDLIEELCEQYQINVAIHNHATPSRYWNPETVLKVCQGRSRRIGVCGDTGHWVRSGINPVDAIRKLGDRIISFHFKDMNAFGRLDAHDVPWGAGKGNVKGMMEEVHRQGIKPLFIIEYEHTATLADIVQCVAYFDKVAAELAAGT